MYVSVEQIQRGLASYADSELIPKVAGLRKWMIAIYAPIAIAKVGDMAISHKSDLIGLGYMSDDGMVDIDRLYSSIIETARKTGPVSEDISPIGKITFDESDIASLYKHIQQS